MDIENASASIIAVFGDVHGALDMMYHLCASQERKRGPIALILQCGDMGIFPNGALDKATRRHAEADPSELGATDYVLGHKICPYPTVFVRGNHEDHVWLSQYPNGGALDNAQKLIYLTACQPLTVTLADISVTIAALGGIKAKSDRKSDKTDFDGGLIASELDAMLTMTPGSVDILLTHDAPLGYGLRHNTKTGSSEITSVIERLQPRFMFFGHYGNPPEPFLIGETQCIGMNNVKAMRIPKRDGAMGLLDVKTWTFEFVGYSR